MILHFWPKTYAMILSWTLCNITCRNTLELFFFCSRNGEFAFEYKKGRLVDDIVNFMIE